MKRRLISAVLLSSFVLLGTHGVCSERVRRPVTSFMDFYTASQHARVRPTLFDRVVIGIAVAAQESTTHSVPDSQHNAR